MCSRYRNIEINLFSMRKQANLRIFIYIRSEYFNLWIKICICAKVLYHQQNYLVNSRKLSSKFSAWNLHEMFWEKLKFVNFIIQITKAKSEDIIYFALTLGISIEKREVPTEKPEKVKML